MKIVEFLINDDDDTGVKTISLVDAPAMESDFIAFDKDEKPFKFNVIADQVMDFMRDRMYLPSLRFFMKYKFLGIMTLVAALLITFGALKGGIM